MTDQLRHDSSVQETQIVHYRRQPPRAQSTPRVHNLTDSIHQSPLRMLCDQTLPQMPPASHEGPEPEKLGPQDEVTASSNHHLLPVNVRACHA